MLEPDKELDCDKFLDDLLEKMKKLEKEDSKDEFLKLDGAEEEFRRVCEIAEDGIAGCDPDLVI